MAKKLTPEEQYIADVYTYLDKLPACVVAVDKLCKPENRDKFLSVVKDYIEKRGVYNGYITEFTNDYTAVKKIDVDLRLPSEKLQDEINQQSAIVRE